MKMICNKAEICGIDCEDKKPHEKEIACSVECDWHGKCIPLPNKIGGTEGQNGQSIQ